MPPKKKSPSKSPEKAENADGTAETSAVAESPKKGKKTKSKDDGEQGKPKKILRRYPPESLKRAYDLAKFNGVPIDRAARMCNVPAQTLRDRVKGRVDPDVLTKFGPSLMLTTEQEEALVEHIETMAQSGYTYTNQRLKQLAGEMAFQFGAKKHNKDVSNKWLYAFLKRWDSRLSSVKQSKPNCTLTNAKLSLREKVVEYFKKLGETIQEYDLADKPQYIYNLAETVLQAEEQTSEDIESTNSECKSETSPHSTTTTLIGCVNALRHALPPYFIFKGNKFSPELMNGSCTGAKGVMSGSGSFNAQQFHDYLENHFLPYTRPCAADKQPILLIFDGNMLYKSSLLIKWAREKHILLFVLPTQSSYILSPLNVGVFGHFMDFFYTECSSFMTQNIDRPITQYDICRIACNAYTQSMTMFNIQGAFCKTGIFPLNSKTITDDESLFLTEFGSDETPVVEKSHKKDSHKRDIELFIQAKERNFLDSAILACSVMHSSPSAGNSTITDDIDAINNYEFQRSNTTLTPSRPKKAKMKPKLSSILNPKPSTSGTCEPDQTNETVNNCADSDKKSPDVSGADLCCVCNKHSPPNRNKIPSLKMLNWAQCDVCGHWTHLAFCTSVRVVRGSSTFLCPHCQN